MGSDRLFILGRRGGATVEYAVVFPLVLLVVCLVLQLAVLAHDRTVLRAEVAGAAAALADAWTDVGVPEASGAMEAIGMPDGYDTDMPRMEPDMYWQVRTLLGAGTGVERRMAENIAAMLGHRRWLPGSGLGMVDPEEIEVRVSCTGGLPFAVLRVSVSVPVGGPAAGWRRFAGSRGALRIRACAEVLVLSHRTVIQDMDQGLQLLQTADAVARVAAFSEKLGNGLAMVAEWAGVRQGEE